MTQVNLYHLTKVYPGSQAPAVDNFSLEIVSGEITAFLGPSGCGKTTTLKMIAGLLHPSQGNITFDGESVLTIPAEKRGAVMVFQNYLLFPYMTVGQNVGFGLKMRGEKKAVIDQRVREMLELVRLSGMEERRPKQLSGGQQQRVALARALVIGPKVLLLDEPLSNLDAHLRDEMRELILSIQRQLKITTIFVTHDQEEAVILADRIALIFDGKLEQFAGPDSFYERPTSIRAARFFGGVNFIEGVKRDNRLETHLGEFALNGHQSMPDGKFIATVRPEGLKMGVDGGQNTVRGQIVSRVYLGTYTRYRVRVEDQEFQVVAEAESVHTYNEGDIVPLVFPPEKLWLVPPDTSTGSPG